MQTATLIEDEANLIDVKTENSTTVQDLKYHRRKKIFHTDNLHSDVITKIGL